MPSLGCRCCALDACMLIDGARQKDWLGPLPMALNAVCCEVSHLGAAALEALDVLVHRRLGVGRRRGVHALTRAARCRLLAA
jgi:hypothetical protein